MSDKYCYVDECGNRIGSRFNSYECGKLLGWFEEVLNNNGEFHSRNELMKNKITDKDTLIEQKGIDPYTAKNQCNYCFSTNGSNPVKIEKNEERYLVLKVNPKMKAQKEYFTRIFEIIKTNIEELRFYFENREVKFNDLKVVETDASKNLVWLNSNNTQNFIDEELDEIMTEKEQIICCKELYELYKMYYLDNPDGRKLYTFKYFIDYIVNNSIYKKMENLDKKTFIVGENIKKIGKYQRVEKIEEDNI
jgi:hypothetical protein